MVFVRLIALLVPVKLLLASLPLIEKLQLERRFSWDLTQKSPVVGVDQPPSSRVLFSRELPVDAIVNIHYHTSLTVRLGASGALYSISANEEKPAPNERFGQFILFLTQEGRQRPDLTINGQTIYRPLRRLRGRSFILEGISYEFKYVPRNFLINPYLGDLFITPESGNLPSYRIRLEDMIRALYEKAVPMGSIPFKIAMFSKYSNPREYWILVMNDVGEEYQNYQRFHLDWRELPINTEDRQAPRVISRRFENHVFYLAFIQRRGSLYLYLRVDEP